MSLHRITAGSGYDYLTRQVAAMDSTERGQLGLASYYTEKGEVPGRWIGSGLAGIDGLAAGDVVTAEQMLALFGSGHHPLAAERAAALADSGATEADVRDAIRLGQPFKVYAGDVSPYRVEVTRRLAAHNRTLGRPADAAVDVADRARIRSAVGLEFFRAEFGRDPLNPRELAGHIARLSRQRTTAVAGFDLTFSPVKSVSALWALADPPLAAAIERAHHAAVTDALAFIERQVLFTRTGANGVRQVEVRGLVGAAFTHRDSRAGDPDLHTHVAVANKVQTTTDGRWLSIDSRVLHKAITTASETYNTALEAHLTSRIGVRFDARAATDPHKRPVREIVGVDPRLLDRWSSRRHRIVHRQRELAAAFQHAHGRPPTPVEAIALAQQATLETRDAKHAPRSLAEQRATWQSQAVTVLGDDRSIRAMVAGTLQPAPRPGPVLDRAWFDATAAAIIDRVQQDRSVWQSWHVRAEALRRIRGAGIAPERATAVVDWLTRHVLDHHCVPLSTDQDGIDEPVPLRRCDGASVYTVAGSRLFTSAAILAAEQRLLAHAARRDGRTVPDTAIDLALLRTAADGTRLNPGQVALVRAMATSGARVQLAIAPAGAGKTTAMHALAAAWTAGGGTVLGLAPSAVAAAGLGDQIAAPADTLAKLAWHLHQGQPPAWLHQLGPDTLVIIDEAGMADTLTLDTVIGHILERGGSVRLIGDDQQLAAIGAGGVLRDIRAHHGALHLTELVRFTNPAEGSASLALRDGHPEALGFYLDHQRVHIGDTTTMAEDLFGAWATDRAAGRDSVMLAPTRDLVADLNQRARTHRLSGQPAGPDVELADGNHASAGDTIITRHNDRSLRLNATNWVKNGDRWTIENLGADGARVRHTQTGRHITLPPDYLATWTELGYACTTHTAQGVTADTCHGLLTGDETRQQAYTMLTRGRIANTAYLVIVGDGDPHSLTWPDTINPATAVDTLEQILARDESPLSATSTLRQAADPAAQLGQASGRYRDAIVFAADHTTSPADRHTIQRATERLLPGITRADAWPTLQAHLHTINADGRDPIRALRDAMADLPDDDHDPAALLAWRLDNDTPSRRGPLPWLHPIPHRLQHDPLWGPYLHARADRVRTLADDVRAQARQATQLPAWAADSPPIPAALRADIEVWRAANAVPDADRRPTGEPNSNGPTGRWQQHLDRRLAAGHTIALDEWAPLLHDLDPCLDHDPYLGTLAHRIARLSAAGLPMPALLRHAHAEGPLPDEHAAAALWWRISAHISPAVATELSEGQPLTTDWLPQLTVSLGDTLAGELQTSTWWPALVTTIDHARQRGWSLDALLAITPTPTATADACQAWVWRLSLATDPLPYAEDAPPHPDHEPPADLHIGWTPPDHAADVGNGAVPTEEPLGTWDEEEDDPDREADRIIALEALIRAHPTPPELSPAEIRRMQDRADAWHDSPHTPERLAHLNELATRFYEARFPESWAQPYLHDRLRHDLTGHPEIRPGYAPASWTALVDHLRRQGATDDELLTVGLASRSRTGNLIDRFRDRLVFPITHHGEILGFVGRRNPDTTDDRVPKYLNTPDTPLFHKGDQLYVIGQSDDATPVLVEGPLDAIAISIAAGEGYFGTAPLGTALAEAQARQLAAMSTAPIVATDADAAGQAAAERDYWLLARLGAHALAADLPIGRDPADMVRDGQGALLLQRLQRAAPLDEQLLDRHLSSTSDVTGTLRSVQVLSTTQPNRWSDGMLTIADRTGLSPATIRTLLASTLQTTRAGSATEQSPSGGTLSPAHGARPSHDRASQHPNERRRIIVAHRPGLRR